MIWRRLFQVVPVVFGALLLVFVLFNCVGADPAERALGRYATPDRIAEFRAEYGLDRSLPAQFGRQLYELVSFNFGLSLSSRQPVALLLREGIGPSLSLALPAFVLSALLSVAFGLLAARLRGRWFDSLLGWLCICGLSFPAVALVVVAQYYLAFRFGWFPISGFEKAWPDRMMFLALPILLWVLMAVAKDVRLFRSIFIEELKRDYIAAARGRGVGEVSLLFRHVLKNSMGPLMAVWSTELPYLFLGSFLLEAYFGIPGLGSLAVEAVRNGDFPVVRALAALVAVGFVVVTAVVDLLQIIFDRRLC
jgi:peptide/nickel transport system permease protein